MRLDVEHVTGVHTPARCIETGLRILAVVDQPHHRLQMRLRLHRPAHDAERKHRFAILRHESGDDGVERTLAAADLVRMARLERESRPAILQADPGARHDDARAEALIVRLDQRDHHAGLIGGRQIDRPAGGRHSMLEASGALRVDQLRTLLQVALVEQLRRRKLHRPRIGDIAVDVGERELHRLDLDVQRRG